MSTFSDIADFFHNVQYIAAGVAILGGMVMTFWKIIFPLKKEWETNVRLLSTIAKEFQPNGGSSIRDSMNRVEKSQVQIENSIKELQEVSQKQHERQWALAATQNDPIWESDSDGMCIKINARLANLTQRGIEDFRGSGWENVVYNPDRARVFSEWKDAVEKERAFESEYRVISAVTKDIYQIKAIATPYFTEDNRLLGYIGRYIEATKISL